MSIARTLKLSRLREEIDGEEEGEEEKKQKEKHKKHMHTVRKDE